jgi:hypothetical protein
LLSLGHLLYSGQRTAPPENALAPPVVLIPTYPSSTLNNYYNQLNPFIYNDQHNVHIFAPITSDFYDLHILPPSASKTHIPTILCTPSSPL